MGRGIPVAGLAAALLLGCAKAWVPQPLSAAAVAEWREGDEIVANDRAVFDRLVVQNARTQQNAQGRMVVEVVLQNVVNRDVEIQARTVFRDADNFDLSGDDTGWQVVLVPANGTRTLRETSLSTKAAAYSIRLRTPGAGS